MRKIILLILAPLFLLITVKMAYADNEVVAKGQKDSVSISTLITYEEFAEHQMHLMNLTNSKERNEYIQDFKTIMKQRASDEGVSIAGMHQGNRKSINAESGIEISNLSDE